MGRFRTQSLFFEYRHPDYPAPFTLKDQAHKGRVSMYEYYVNAGDPTEYTQALGLLGSWRHWELLSQCEWFKPHLTRWRAELKVKFESDRFKEMEEVARKEKGTPLGVNASKWLAERYTAQTKAPKRGRPTNAEKKAALREHTEEQDLLTEEATRLGMK